MLMLMLNFSFTFGKKWVQHIAPSTKGYHVRGNQSCSKSSLVTVGRAAEIVVQAQAQAPLLSNSSYGLAQ
jgi:hypothetical protein